MKSWKILLLFVLWACEATQHTLGVLPDEEERLGMNPWKTLLDDVKPITRTPLESATGAADASAETMETERPRADPDRGSEFSPVVPQSPASSKPSPPEDDDGDGGIPMAGDDAADDDLGEGCSPAPTTLRTAKLVVVIDSTFQVDLPPELGAPQVNAGVEQYLDDPRSANSQLGLYVVKNECRELDYLRPDASLSELPIGAPLIRAQLPSSRLSLAQAEMAVLKAVEYANEERMEDPNSGYAVAVISDGFVFGICIGSGPADLMTAFASGQALEPPMNVHLVSLQVGGFEGGQWTPSASAEALARAGGTEEPLVAELLSRPGTRTDAINEALQQVRSEAQPCVVDVHADMSPEALSVRLDGSQIPQTMDREGCGEDDGFFWVDPDDLTQGLELCLNTCTRLKELGAAQLSVQNCEGP